MPLGLEPLDPGDPLDPIGGPILGGDPIISGMQDLLDAFSRRLASFFATLANFFSAFGGIFKAIGGFLKHIWENYIKAAISWLADHIGKLRNWLKRTIGPIIKRLEKIKKWYDDHILKQQLRLIAMIQRVRQILGILRIFHVKWAAKLDASLADIQNRIEETIAIVRGTLNQIINTLAIAFDPTMLIHSNVLGASLLANLGAVKRIFAFGGNRIISATELATMDFNRTRYQKQSVQSHLSALATTGPTQQDQAERTAARSALATANGAPLPF